METELKFALSPGARRDVEQQVLASADLDGNRLREVRGLPVPARDSSSLAPVFRTEVTRTRCLLAPVAATRIELAFDEGAVAADGSSKPLSELEIELKEGSEAVLLRLGLDLLRPARA